MKWAPNKKLHFEVAIIRAIQTLGQATLDEVIEKLSELRDGKIVASEKTSPSVAAVESLASKNPAADTTATTAPRVEEKAAIDLGEIWQQVVAKIPTQKGFMRNSASAAHVLGIEGRNLKVGFAPGDKAAMDYLSTQTNRRLVETLLREITGKDWSLKLTVNEELASRNAALPKHPPSHDFKEETLIREAIELFNAKIRS